MGKTKMTRDEAVACYLVDRADQYDTDSPCWIALTDAAQDIVNGEHRQSELEGDLDDLLKRVRSWKGTPGHPVQPSLGTSEEDYEDDGGRA